MNKLNMRLCHAQCWRSILGVVLTFFLLNNAHTDAPTKHALLIGIDEYKAVGDLNGCVNDIELMRSILIGKFDIPDENIKLLKNEEASRAEIINSIQTHLIDRANPGDVVLLHYSGHGSQMLDQPGGDEIDGYDETIVPHDSRTEGVFDISDDEINGLMRKLTERTKNVTFILDSCHSGAAARAGNAVRMVEPDDRPPPAAADFAVSSRGGEGDAGIRLNGADYVLISGCLATELSNETEFNSRRHGAMTWFLAEALQAAKPDATYRSVMDSVQANVTNRFPSQHPQIEGPGMDLKVFGTDKINAHPYVLVGAVDGAMLKLNGGSLVGLKKGALLKVYAPGTSDLDNAEPIASIKIVAVDDFTAQAEIVEGAEVPPQSRALIEYTNFAGATATVYVNTSQSASMSEVKQLLAESNTLVLVDSQDRALLVVEQQDDAISVRSGDLEQLAPPVSIEDPDHVEHVTNQVKDIVHWRTLRDLHNPGSSLKVGFETYIKNASTKLSDSATVTPGERIIYKVKNLESNTPLFVYVLDISSDGSVALLYPPMGEQQELAPGAVLEREVEMFLPPTHRSVTDVFKVISTTRYIDPAIFPQGAVRSAPLPQGVRSVSDPLAKFLAEASRGTRGAAPVEVDTWVTSQHSLVIRPPAARTSGFTLHFDEPQPADEIPGTLGASRNLCQEGQDPVSSLCFSLRALDAESTLFEIDSRQLKRSDSENRSIGAIFEEAYQIQDQTGAIRVEPKLEVEAPGVVDQQGVDKREILGDSSHDEAAQNDDQWNLKQIQVMPAWQKIRDRYGVVEGQEGDGIIVAHTDTGYLPHPENWQEVNGKRPIDPAKGHDYFDDDDDPIDPLLSDNKLDNPGHGTASGSVIVSPFGCQLPNTPGCVYGVARGAQLAPLRVHRTVSQFDTSNLAKAIRDVANGNIKGEPKLISTAMGGPPTLDLYKAVKAAEKNGILMVAAAGNYVRTVVWPARFDSTIAAAAVNVRCRPWKHSSRGKSVDISAPGESVWRATLNKDGDFINFMGKGTTFATGNTTSAAALWLSWHRDDPELAELQRTGGVTKAFRNALAQSAWQPTGTSADPVGSHCDNFDWDSKKYGPGILSINALLDVPLQEMETRRMGDAELEHIPLFVSLYPEQSPTAQITSDFRTILNSAEDSSIVKLSMFETEIMYHYTVNEDVQRTIDAVVAGQRGDEPMSRIRASLLNQDLSSRLRELLMQPGGS